VCSGMALDANRELAARKILKVWQSFRDRRVFAYLRHAVCRAEDSLTFQVLRKVTPIEAYLLRDPTLNARLRFRFAGSTFPPVILYKIFVNANVQYLAGSTKIMAGSKAANDACDVMGERKYFDIVLADIESCTPVSDARLAEERQISIPVRLREHGQFDEHPIWLGGRGNGWRMLIDDKFCYNDNILRFDASKDIASGKSGKLMAAMLQTVEQSVLAQHAQSTVPLNKQYASKDTLDRIKTSQARARSRGMHKLYSSHLHASQEGGSGPGNLTDDGTEQLLVEDDRTDPPRSPNSKHASTVASMERSRPRGVHEGSPERSSVSFSANSGGKRWPTSSGLSGSPPRSSGRLGSSRSPPRTQGSSILSTVGSRSSRGGDAYNDSYDGMGASSMDEDALDNVADSLLNWAGGLSFEQYHETWEKTAATMLPEPTL
jgi:hypothetical protein